MDMDKLERVIEGLKVCTNPETKRGCLDGLCPYDGKGCRGAMEMDALELLKEQEEKKGQWIPIESPTGVEAFGVKEMTVIDVRCSVCGSKEDVSFTGYKYCPRCGAKMTGRR